MYPTASSTKHRYQAYPNNSPMSTGSSTATPGQNLSFGYNSRYLNVAPTGPPPPPPPRSPSAASYASASTYRDNYKRQDYSYPYDTRRRPGGYDDDTESRASLSTSAWGTTVTHSSPRSSLLSASISESGSESEESVGFDPRTRYSAGSGSRSRTYGMGATPTTPAGGYRAEYTPHAGGTRTSAPPMERTISQSWGGSESSRSSFSGFAASQTSSWSGAPNTEQSRSEGS
ncbi:hypothetical protein BDN72DRAFT_311476 [Pluteus cervinus]|uniref:Uncharacterized protein n=1 Tax=Pluteus cervinus TaxID=181527 RepID=A0ACD3ACT5_9AGAR|nr:hypothetical protein BDN72DRAFT_311476 [Pluteus cervinus]